MIKIALKHWIYEACIYVFFKGIYNNFILPKFITKVRAIRAGWSIDLKQDLAISHGEEIDRLMENALAHAIREEIDREIIEKLMRKANV